MLKIRQKKIDFRCEVKSDPINDLAKVYLYGDIVDERPRDWWTGEEVEGDYIIPGEVRNLLEGISEGNIHIHINSYGGSVFASVAILNHIKALEGKNIETFNDGICASGASLIFMAGEKRYMPENTMLMIHRASTFGWGNVNELRKVADTLEKLDNNVVFKTYEAHFKGEKEELYSLVDDETWLSAEESEKYGLCTDIIKLVEDKPAVEDVTNEADIAFGLKFMKNFANLKIKGE